MKTLILLFLLIAAWPAGSGAASRFELHSQFTPVPKATAGRFALRSQLQPDSGGSDTAARFSLKAVPVVSGAVCADILFRDGFE